MTRILAASSPTARMGAETDPDILADTLLNTPEAKFDRALVELRDYGAEHKTLTERLAELEERLPILEAQLDDPALHGHQARFTALRRREAWREEVSAIPGKIDATEHEAHMVRLAIASLWHRLPLKARREAKQQLGALADGAAPRIALALWEHVKAGRDVPGLAPF